MTDAGGSATVRYLKSMSLVVTKIKYLRYVHVQLSGIGSEHHISEHVKWYCPFILPFILLIQNYGKSLNVNL
jgi:hypothetical protein